MGILGDLFGSNKPKRKRRRSSSGGQTYKITKSGSGYRVASRHSGKTLWSITVATKAEAHEVVRERKQHMKDRRG